jgi:hypothetical protein
MHVLYQFYVISFENLYSENKIFCESTCINGSDQKQSNQLLVGRRRPFGAPLPTRRFSAHCYCIFVNQLLQHYGFSHVEL